MPQIAHGRIDGLVTWRALLMLGGLVLHATIDQERYPPFAAINIVSASFRMGAFFVISGLLTGFALTRQPDGREWLHRRLLQLSLPTLVAVLTICPIVRLLFTLADPAHPPGLSIYHLWFMVALLYYTLLAYGLHRIDRLWRVFAHVENASFVARMRQSVLLMGTGTLSFVLILQLSPICARLVPDQPSLIQQAPIIIGNIPTFLLGFACGRMPTLRRVFIAGRRVPLAILAGAALAHWLVRSDWMTMRFDDGVIANARMIVLIAGTAWCPPAATALILRSAMAMQGVSPLIRRLADASFTMYIVHYPIMLAIKLTLRPIGLGPWAGFTIALVLGGALSWLIHDRLVSRSRWLQLLVNGRLPRSMAPTGAPIGVTALAGQARS
jgi:glucan biosynthesis protein C